MHKEYSKQKNSTTFKETSLWLKFHSGFTLTEVLVTIAISSTLFLAIPSLMVNFFRINTVIKENINLNHYKDITYLTLQNFFDEADTVLYLDDTTDPDKHTLIFQNKNSDALLPFTAIDVQGDTLSFANFALDAEKYAADQSDPNAFIAIPPTRSITEGSDTYSIDYANSQIIKGSSPSTYCASGSDNNCIITGEKQHALLYNTAAFAPFIQIKKPTDLLYQTAQDCNSNTTSDDHLCILSPFEKREYQINLETLAIIITDRASSETFPYFYDTGTPTSISFSSFPPLSNIPSSDIGLKTTSFQFLRDVYGSSSEYELNQVIYTLESTKSPDEEITAFLFKTFRK